LKLKERPRKGTTYNCPELYCKFYTVSAKNFYDHLKLVHNFYDFGEKNRDRLIATGKFGEMVHQNQKLRELLEKWIDRPECTYQTHKYLKSILEASKK